MYIKKEKVSKTIISGIVEKEGYDNNYPVLVSVNIKDSIKGTIYYIDYRLVKEVNINSSNKNFE